MSDIDNPCEMGILHEPGGVDDLCEMFEKNLLHDSAAAYETLQESQCYTLSQVSDEFIHKTRARYTEYLAHINFSLYQEAGERIVLLIHDFMDTTMGTGSFLKLQGCKCQTIDRLIIELINWLRTYGDD
jgi:hypothetical protein